MKNVVCGFIKNVVNLKTLTSELLVYRPCKNKPNDYLDNIWHQFPFADDFFEDREHVPSSEQTNVDFDTSNSIDNWKVLKH